MSSNAILPRIPRQSDNHRCFVQPANRETRVWRYMNVERFAQLIRTGMLWFARSDKLGDPCEGWRPAGDAAIYAAAEKEIVARGDSKLLPMMRMQWKHMDERARKSMFISCWQMAEHEDVSMWERYTERKELGVAIQTTYSRLDDAVPTVFASDRHVMLGLVSYGDYQSPEFRSDPSNMYSAFMLKKIEYRTECEVRLVCDMFKGDNLDGIAVPVHLPRLIERVVVSPYAPANFERYVTGIRNSKSYTFDVTRSSVLDRAKVY